ncbi:MAG TPA: glycosyltransferase family 87 protein [Acidobacteriaceae bacterium]|nr:glycosyltransferase family 87 protein [Acidobacteriaceae bacterium]
MNTAPQTKDRAALALVLICFAMLAAVTVRLFLPPYPLFDFSGYWSAGRLFLEGQDPYSSASLLSLEHELGWQHRGPLVMLCPPWSLPFLAPPAMFSYAHARVLWMAVTLSLDAFSAAGLWHFFGGSRRQAWIAGAVFLAFVPLGSAEGLGQITPLILAALTAFLLLTQAKRWFLAGLTLIGFGIKPQLLWLVAAAVLLWALQERRFRLIAGGAVSLAAFWGGAFAWNRSIASYPGSAYSAAIETNCGIGGLLRQLVPGTHPWLQYIPCVFGAAWFVWYWLRHRRGWDWRQHLPLLLLVSLASAPYCWFHDFTLALPAFVQLAVERAQRSPLVIGSWFLLQVVILTPDNKPLASTLSALWIVFWLFARSEARHAALSPARSAQPAAE